MSLLVVGNLGEMELGLLEDLLSPLFRHVRFVGREDLDHRSTHSNADLLLLLGSDWSVYDQSVRESVSREIGLVREFASRGIPVLGICFGAQLISRAFGGTISRAEAPEIGWNEIFATQPNSVFGGSWMQWHYDSFSVPVGFELLAQNEYGPQVIRSGRVLGVQFHPEANELVVSKWMSGEGAAELDALGIAPSSLLDETRRGVNRTSVASRKLMDWFLEEVAQGPVAPSPSN